MNRHPRFVRLPLLMCWVLLAPMLASGSADQPAAGPAKKDDSSATLRFRRVYVPADQIDQLPRHGVRYVPMDAAEFERAAANLSGARQPSAQALAQPPNVEVTRAVYEARLSGEVLTDGKATLEIRDAEKDPALLRFDSCRLPVETPRWIRNASATEVAPPTPSTAEAATAPQPVTQPATIGVGPDEKLLLRVERSGTLQFDWSLIGRRETGAALVFDLGLPPAPSNELRLALPPDLVPSVEQGFVTLVAAKKGDGSDSQRHWDVELGGQTQIMLRLGRQDFLREIRPLTLVRESMVYDFSPRGMQLSADLKLDVLGEPIQRIGLLLDQPLALVTARYGGTQLPWYEIDPAGKKIAGADSREHDSRGHGSTGQNDRSGTHRVVVELPEPLHGTGRVLRLGFVAPPFARGRLPTVRPTGDGLFWQEGSASLLVPLPLALDELTLRGCRQTKAEPLPAPAVGDAIAIQYFRPDADVEIGLARGGERLQVQCGTSIDVRGGTMTGRCRADITAEDGECFKLSADVSPSWIIDLVETVPADSLADWSYTPGNGPAARLDITLAKSIRPDWPLRLLVGGRWRRSPRGEKLRAGDLEMVTLRGATATRCVSAVHSAAPYRLQTEGGQELLRLDPARLSPTDAALLGGAPIADGTMVFVVDEAARDLTVTMANEMPRYSGAVHLDAQVSDTTLVEAYRIECQPESAELDRLLVHFTRRRDEPVRWNLVTPDSEGAAENAFSTAGPLTGGVAGGSVVAGSADLQDRLSARRLSADQQSALGLAAGGELWELTFRQPGNTKLEIQAVRSSTLAADTPLSLAELAQASEQQGSVAIWATGRRIPQINNRRLKPVPIDPAANDSPSRTPADQLPRTPADQPPRSATELAAYQYDPVEEIISAAVDPAPSLTVSPGTDRPAAWAWSCRLDSYFSPDGSSQHLACWRIENTGRTRVRFHMPAGATFHSAWIDDVLCPASTVTADAASAGAMSIDPSARGSDRANLALPNAATNAGVRFELPAGRRFVRVVLQWGSDDGPLSLLASRTSQLPEIDMPVMKRQWHVWLPPRFRLSNPNADSQAALAAPDSWRQRLFGPFGKPVGEAAFNPLHGDNWVAMVRRLTSDDPAWTQARRMVERMTRRGTSRSAVTWGTLLADAQSDAARPDATMPSGDGLPLLVDARSLADIGLSPQSPVCAAPPDAARGWPLAQADLVLMVAPRAVVLTTHSAASVWLGPWTTDGSVLQRAPPGPFDEELQLALAGNSERFVPAELWNFPTGKSPWAAAPWAAAPWAAAPWAAAPWAGDAPAIDHAGWTVYDLDLSESPRQIGIVDRDRMIVVGCGLFLLCVLLVFAKGDVSWKHQAIALIVATALSLSLPSSCAPLGTGLWLGLAAGWTLRWLARWDRPLGAYSRCLLAAAAGSGTIAAVAAASPTNGPTGESGDATSLSVPTDPWATSSVRKRGGPGGPALGLLLVLGCWMWHDAGAAEPAGRVPAERARPQASRGVAQDAEPIQDVWIPSDDQQHLKGSVYLVPEELYRALVPRGGRSPANAPRNWLITAATYRGGLTRQEKTAALDTTDWSATYDLDVLSAGAHVWIPLGDSDANRSPVNLLPDGVRVDGQSVLFQWEIRGHGPGVRGQDEETRSGAVGEGAGKPAANGQRGIGFDVGATGHHQVELAFRPSLQQRAGATTLDFAILPLATSRLELTMPADVPVEAPGARGRPSLDRAHGRLTESLGPIDRLTVCGWSDPAGGEGKPPVVDVDELYWLKVRPGSVVLEAKFNVRVAEGRLTQLRLLEDPRLRRLPLEAGSPISEVRTEEGDLHTVFVGLAQPVVDRTTFKLSFLLTDTSGIGDLRLPKLEVVGARSENRRLAVSVESPLEFDPPSAAAAVAASGAIAQFLSGWGAADAKPQLAYALPPGDVTWNLPIHSRQPQLESREQLAIAIERGRLRQTWLADLTVLGGTVFQIQLPAPPQWIVEQALFRQEGLPDQDIRCARAPGGALTLFLPGPAPEHSKLFLRGSMPYTPGAVTSISELHIIGPSAAKVTSQSILLLRGADVQVAVADAAGMQQLAKGALQSAVDAALSDGLLDRAAMGHLRPAACLSGFAAPGANPAVRIAANSPRVEGKELTTVRRVNESWTATVDLDLQVSGGVLDGLRFDLPPQWSEPAEIKPDTPSQLIDVPGEHRRQLILRPADAWSGAVRIHLSGPIVTPVGQRMRVPNVRPLGIGQLHRYVLLPTRSGEQNLSWEASGLNFEPLPKKFSPESPPIDLYRTCEVVSEHFEATLKSVEKTIGQPRVRLADIAVACSDHGHCHGAATFALDPAGALNCLLELAPNEHLIHVRADGVAAAARPVGENHWSVALGDGKLPQQIEVVFTADLPDEPAREGPLLLSAPVLVDLPVEQTLWSVVAASGDTSTAANMAVAGAAPATEIHQALIRQETISKLLDAASRAPAAGPDDPITSWFAAWRHRLLLARGAVDRCRASQRSSESGRAVDNADALTAVVADDAFDLWKQTDGAAYPVAGYYVHGFGPTLALTLPNQSLGGAGWRLIAAILGATVVGLLFWLGGWTSERASRLHGPRFGAAIRPALLGAAAGVFWWLAMEPSWLGLVVIVASVAAMLRSRWSPAKTPVSADP